MEDQNKGEHYDESGNYSSEDDTSDVQVEEEYIEVVGSDQDEENNKVTEEASSYKPGPTVQHTEHDEKPHVQCQSPKMEDLRKQTLCCGDKLIDDTELIYNADILENLEERIGEECSETNVEETNTSVGGGDLVTDATSPWVFLIESQRYRDKVIKQFEDKPMSIKRSKQEISTSKRQHHIVVYPIPPDVLSDPRLLDIFDKCTEVHVDFHNICSSTATNSRMAGYLQLWFKQVSDMKENISYLHQLGGSSAQLFCESLSEEINYAEFHEAWKEHYQGSLDTTLFVPFLPSKVTEDDLWNIFPLANIIAIPDDCKPDFRYAYVIFTHRETMLSAIEAANTQSRPSSMKTLHLVPIEYLLLNKQDAAIFNQQKSDKQAKKLKEQMQNKQHKSCSAPEDERKKLMEKSMKSIKSHSVVSKKNRSHHPRNKVNPRLYSYRKQTEDTGDWISLANLLATLGPQAPDVINTLAQALEKTQFQEEYVSKEHLNMSPHAAPENTRSPVKGHAISKHRERRYGQMPCQQPLPKENIRISEQKKQPMEQEKRRNKQTWKMQQEKWKCKGQQQRKSKDSNKQLQWNAVPASGWESTQGSVKSSNEELFDYWVEGLPAFTQGQNKRQSGKTKQNRNPTSQQRATNNDDSQSTHTRVKTYRELVHAHEFSAAVEDSDEYKMWVSANLKDLKKEKRVKSAGPTAGGAKRKSKSFDRC